MSLQWKSQHFVAEGSSTASGILRQLGRPSLDEFTILVREAAQNSWDARRGDCDVDFSIRLERLGDRTSQWRKLLLPGPAAQSIPDFGNALTPESWHLVVSDRGTHGLGGPVRATSRPAEGERNDFVQFLRNVGEPRDNELGGGTYGFGKGIFYRTSSVRSIIADSRTIGDDGYERRMMGAALGDDFWTIDNTRFTGRHWWGSVKADGVVDPLTGADADDAANLLGLPGFEPDQTGTTVVVLGADLGLAWDECDSGFADPQALGIHLASAMLWNLWPRFRSTTPVAESAMRFSVSVDGREISIPAPQDVATLRPFVDAHRSLGKSSRSRSYRRTAAPKIHVGDLAVENGIAPQEETLLVQSARPFMGAAHHVARMRQAGLVVDYFEGPVHPDPLFIYGGVFRATPEADKYFAASEPPTHDRWNPEGLDASSRAVVEGARRWTRDYLNKRFPAVTASAGSSATGLGQGSRRLSALVAAVSATGTDPASDLGPTTGGDGGSGGPGGGAFGSGGNGESPGANGAKVSVHLIGDPWVSNYEGSLAAFARVRVTRPEMVASIRATLDVVLDGGSREGQPPAGAFTPQVIGWMGPDAASLVCQGETLTDIGGAEDWVVLAQFSDASLTRFRLELEALQ